LAPAEFKGDDVSKVPDALRIVWAFEQAKQATDAKQIISLIKEYNLPHEAIPTQLKTDPRVWSALLPGMGLTAMLRNLANMTRYGTLKALGSDTKFVIDKITNAEELKKSRVHPIAVLTAMMTYQAGHGMRGTNTWTPIGNIVDALDSAFYAAFGNVEPTNKKTLLALDISGSMDGGEVAGVPGLSPRIASAAMALVTAATEKNHHFIAFTCSGGGYYGIREVNITPRDRLDTTVAKSQALAQYMGGTDCALPMLWAEKKKVEVETFVIYTDSETWAGGVAPCQALTNYRKKMGIPAKLVVVGMVANNFSIADPSDSGMMDCIGFSTDTPAVISDFAR
jgi:60 kDa SS-A/Ro ribonucleoprotein